jgi:glycosyltransferase involved in cell wall biosynthesis
MPPAEIFFDLRHANNQTGIGRYARCLAEGFGELDRSVLPDGLRLLVNSNSENWKPGTEHALSPPLTFREQLELPWRLRRADLFHAPFLNVPLAYSGKLVLTVHDFTLLDFIESLSTVVHQTYALWMTRLSIMQADRIITVSTHTKSDLLKRYQFPPDRIDVIHNGLSDDFKPVDPTDVQRDLDALGVSRPYILSLGRNAPHKNFDRVVRAFAGLQRDHPDLSLVLAGKGVSRGSDLGELTDELGLEDSVDLIGYVSESRLPGLYSGAEVFLLPSENEGFGFPPLEAMACHTPCIVSNTSSLPEITGDAALHVDPDDIPAISRAIDALLRDDELSSKLRSKGAKRVNRFGWKRCAEKTIRTYEKALFRA